MTPNEAAQFLADVRQALTNSNRITLEDYAFLYECGIEAPIEDTWSTIK